jgi:hypothetical protein
MSEQTRLIGGRRSVGRSGVGVGVGVGVGGRATVAKMAPPSLNAHGCSNCSYILIKVSSPFRGLSSSPHCEGVAPPLSSGEGGSYCSWTHATAVPMALQQVGSRLHLLLSCVGAGPVAELALLDEDQPHGLRRVREEERGRGRECFGDSMLTRTRQDRFYLESREIE